MMEQGGTKTCRGYGPDGGDGCGEVTNGVDGCGEVTDVVMVVV